MSALSVFRPARFTQLLTSDAQNISRDPTLLFAILMAFAPAIGIAIWRIQINAAAFDAFGLADFTRYIMPMIISLPAFLIGWVTGFLLLEDRDDGPLLALDITPIGKGGFFIYRTSITAIVTIIITLLAMSLLMPETGWMMRMLIAILIAIEAVCAAFILPAIARNKVEGLAVTKLTNIAAIIPLLAIIPSPWRYLGGIIPTYWIGEIFQVSNTQYLPMPAIIVLAGLSHIIVGIALYRIATNRIG